MLERDCHDQFRLFHKDGIDIILTSQFRNGSDVDETISVRIKNPDQADKILNVAVKLFSTHRFHEARMEDIATAACVGKGTLYRYFQDKDELYLALLTKATDQMSAKLLDDVLPHTDPRQRLVALTATVLSFFQARPHLLDLIQHAETLQSDVRPFPWQAPREEMIRVATEAFEQLHAEGQSNGDPTVAALMLLGGLRRLSILSDGVPRHLGRANCRQFPSRTFEHRRWPGNQITRPRRTGVLTIQRCVQR